MAAGRGAAAMAARCFFISRYMSRLFRGCNACGAAHCCPRHGSDGGAWRGSYNGRGSCIELVAALLLLDLRHGRLFIVI